MVCQHLGRRLLCPTFAAMPGAPTARREAKRLSHSSIRSGFRVCAFLARIAGRLGRGASTVEIYSVEKVAECKLDVKSARWSEGQWMRFY